MRAKYTFKTAEGDIVYNSYIPMKAAAYAMKKATRMGFDSLICYCPDGMIYGDYSALLQREQKNIKTTTIKKII